MLSSELNDEVCDATDDDSSNADDKIYICELLNQFPFRGRGVC
jgi:hypothetical protein